jgi:hypothetical protein
MHHHISNKASRRLAQLARISARDGCSCVWCGRELTHTHADATVEHVLPLSAGGADVFENLLLACGDCNHRRQSVSARVWLERCQRLGLSPNRVAVERALTRTSSQNSFR